MGYGTVSGIGRWFRGVKAYEYLYPWFMYLVMIWFGHKAFDLRFRYCREDLCGLRV